MIFDFLFIILILTGIVILVLAVIAGIRRQSRKAYAFLQRYALACLIYITILIIVSLLSGQRIVQMDEDCCFDDWCVAVEDVTFLSRINSVDAAVKANGIFYIVRMRLSNHARGRSQRASSAAAHLLDGQGQQFEVSARGQAAFELQNGEQPPLTVTLPLGASIQTTRVFDLPKDSHDIGLTIQHPLGFAPGLFIIGDQASLFHKRTVIRLR
jgi:hypothetical protein